MIDVPGRDLATATTWHHGLIARWWANFNLGGPEIDFYRSYVEADTPPVVSPPCTCNQLIGSIWRGATGPS